MRVLAASFPDDASARAAREHLIRTFTLDARQIGVGALARDSNVEDRAILAGRFEEDVVNAAREAVGQLGGTMVVDIDDRAGNA